MMSDEKNKKKKWLFIILSCVLALLIAVGGLWYFFFFNNNDAGKKPKKKGVILLTEEEVDDSDDILSDVDTDYTDGEIYFIDEDEFDDINTEQILMLNNKTSVNDKFIGFGAIYYPWIYWNDDAGRNYTEEQRQIELDRLVSSGVTWIRTMIYARPEWFNKTEKTWNYSGAHYNGIVQFLKEIEKRGIDVLLNFEWGGSIQPDSKDNMTIFNDTTLNKIGTMDERIDMFGDFCTTFTQKIKDDGINCVKYITFYSEPSNTKALGGQYGTEEFDTVFLKKVVPAFTKIVKTVHEKFTEAGIRNNYKFIGNNQSAYYYINLYTWQQLKPLYDPVKNYFDEYSYHFYNKVANPKGATYDDFNIIPESYATDVLKHLGVKSNDTWIDEFNVMQNGTDGAFKSLTDQYGGIYALKDEPYTATQLANSLLAFMNNGYKTVGLWTFVNTLWPNSTTTGSEFKSGVLLDGLMPNLMDSQVPYNAYYTYSMISRYCNNAKSVYSCNMDEANGLSASCVYGKDGSVTVYVVNSNLFDVEYKMNFENKISNSILYRHLYNPQTFESDTSAKPIGVDRVLLNVKNGFADKIPAGAVAVYTSSKK